VTLRARPAFDYAETITVGRPSIRPAEAGALLIPASEVRLSPSGKAQAFIQVGGETFVARPQARGVPANPFDERAANRTESVIDEVVGGAFEHSLSRSAEGE